jgi:hypothetical protein
MFRNLVRPFIVLAAVVALVTASALAGEGEESTRPANDYVGAKKCKTCHKGHHAAWLETKHAKAYDALSDEEKKNEECVGCHVTGTTAEDVLLEGIQCEACHGPGSAYKSAKIMSKKKWKADPEGQKKLALEAGLIMPTEEVCTGCHNKKSPTFKEFDFAKAQPKVHPVGEKAEPEKGN